jgi:chromatin remodeling complex protein RSC6
MAKSKTVETTTPIVPTADKPAKAPRAPKVVDAAVAAADATAPAAPKAEKVTKPRAKAAKSADVVVEVVAPVIVDGEVVVAPVVEVPTTADKMTEFGLKLQQLSSLISSLRAEHKALEKSHVRDLKAAQKGSFRRKRSAGNRQPSGFVKPTRISDELALFLGKETGAEMARTAVSKEINEYIKGHSLQDAANGRKINPDAPLAKLLGVKKDEILTYFNLQRYLKHHFVKNVAAAVVV